MKKFKISVFGCVLMSMLITQKETKAAPQVVASSVAQSSTTPASTVSPSSPSPAPVASPPQGASVVIASSPQSAAVKSANATPESVLVLKNPTAPATGVAAPVVVTAGVPAQPVQSTTVVSPAVPVATATPAAAQAAPVASMTPLVSVVPPAPAMNPLPVAKIVPGIPVPVISQPHSSSVSYPLQSAAGVPLTHSPAMPHTQTTQKPESKFVPIAPEKKDETPPAPLKPEKKEHVSAQEMQEHVQALKEVSSRGDEVGDEGPDTMKAPAEKIGFRGNWVKKREWLLQARNEKLKIQNSVQEIRSHRMQFWGKYKTSQDEFDEFYKSVGEVRGKIEAFFMQADIDAHNAKKSENSKVDNQKNKKAQSPEHHELHGDGVKSLLDTYKAELTEALASYKLVNELDGAITKRMEKLDEQVEIANKKENEATQLYDDMWDMIDDEKARGVFYQIKGLKSDIEAVFEYIKGRFIQDFDATLASARNHCEKVKKDFVELEKKVLELVKAKATQSESKQVGEKVAPVKHESSTQTFMGKISDVTFAVWGFFMSMGEAAWNFVRSYDWVGLWHNVVSAAGYVWNKVSTFAEYGYNSLKDLFSGASVTKKVTDDNAIKPMEQYASDGKKATIVPLHKPAVESVSHAHQKEPRATGAAGGGKRHLELEAPQEPEASSVGGIKEEKPNISQKNDKKEEGQNKEGEKDEKSLVNSTIKGMINDEDFHRRWMSLDEDANQA